MPKSKNKSSPKAVEKASQNFNLNNFLPYKAALLASIVSEQFASQYSEKFGITVYEWRVIAHLSQDEVLSVKDISERANMDRAAVTRAAFRLEAKRLLVKRPDSTDRRLVELKLTPAGKKMFNNIVPMANAFEEFLETACAARNLDDPHSVFDTLIAATRSYNFRD